MTTEITKADISAALVAIERSVRDELKRMTRDDLEQFWFYHHDPKKTPERDAYEFLDMLELYSRKCRSWEELHNGSVCVVERVRDTYLMPKIKAWLQQNGGKPL